MSRCTRQAIRLGCGIWLGGLLLAGMAHEPALVRVALMTLEQGEIAQGVVDLATAKLSAEPGVAMLERAEVDRLFEEQERSMVLAGDESLALRAGQMLAADVLGVMEFDASTSDALGLVVFDAHSGARLWDATLPPGMSEAVDMIAIGFCQALVKRGQAGVISNTVCVLTIRNEDLPEETGSALEGIGRLVERKLTSSERLSVLERQRLSFFNEERETAGQLLPLPGAMTLAELSFRQGGSGNGVEAWVRLTDFSGAILREQRFPARNLDAGMAGEMSEWVCNALEGGCILPQASPEREAEQFLKESVFWFGYYPAHLDKALRAAEAAYALDPESAKIREQLVACLIEYQMTWKQPLRFLRRAIDLQDGLVREGFFREVDQSRLIGATGAHCRYECHMWQAIRQAVAQVRVDSDLGVTFEEICQRHRSTMREINRQRLATVKSAQTFNRYLQWFNFYISKTHEIWALSGRDWTDETIELFAPVLELARKYPLYGSREFEVNRVFLRPATKTRQFEREPKECSLWQLEKADYCRLAGLFGQMAEHTNPMIAIYGRNGLLLSDWRIGKIGKAGLREPFAQLREFGLSAIAASREDGSTPAFRAMLYQAMLDAVDSLPDLKMRRVEQQRLFDYMIDHGEFVHTVEGTVTRPDVGPYAVYAGIGDSLPYAEIQSGATLPRETRLFNMHRALGALADSETVILRGTREVAESSLQARLVEMGEFPAAVTSRPWAEAKRLLDPKGVDNFRTFSRSIYRDGKIIVALLQEGETGSELSVKGISLPSGEVEHVGSVHVAEPKRLLHQGWRLDTVALGERHFYVGTSSAGIFEFPLDGGNVLRFSTSNGLPSDTVQSLAVAGERLFAGLGEWGKATYFVEISTATGEVALRGSSLRRTIESPVDNASPQPFFGDMHVDLENHRLYFLLHVAPNVLPCAFRGLWSFDLETGEYAQHAHLTRNLHRLSAQPDGILYLMNDSTIVRYQPADGSVQLVYTVRQDPPVGAGLPVGSAEVKERYWMIAPFAFEDDSIWAGRAFSRLRIRERQHEVLPPPDPRLNRPVGHWLGLEYLSDPHALLASLDDGIWLLKLTSEPAIIHEREKAPPL